MTISNISSDATGPIVTKFNIEPVGLREQKFVQMVQVIFCASFDMFVTSIVLN